MTLAAVTLFDDSICDYEQGTATVNRLKGRDDGAIDWSPNSNGPDNVAVAVDPNHFFDSYFGVFGYQSLIPKALYVRERVG